MLSYFWDTLYCDFYSPTLLKSRSSITFSHGCQQILDDDDDDVDKETKLKVFFSQWLLFLSVANPNDFFANIAGKSDSSNR